MQTVSLERPRGKKPGWQRPFMENTMSVVFLVLGLFAFPILSLSYTIKPNSNHALGWVLVVVSILACYTAFTSFAVYHYKKRKRQCADNFSKLGEDIVYCGPTVRGWIACGKDWISSTGLPNDTQRLLASDIENFAWGYPKGSNHKFRPDSMFALPNFLVKKPIKRFWILIPSKQEPTNSILVFFYREAEMLQWKSIIESLIEQKPLPIFAIQTSPTKKQLATKAGFAAQVYGQIFLFAILGILLFAYLHDHGQMNAIFSVCIALSAFPSLSWNDIQPDLALISYQFRYQTYGGDPNEVLKMDQLPVADGTLVLLSPTASNKGGVDEIPLTRIGKVVLENWGHSFVDRDLSKILKKDEPPKSMVVRLYLDDPENPEREIKLLTVLAERWYLELKSLIGQRS
jgi:hypothetical protein